MLKRHLASDHKLTPIEYRQKWDLPNEYPIVAPEYAVARSRLAKKIGLGKKSVICMTGKTGREARWRQRDAADGAG